MQGASDRELIQTGEVKKGQVRISLNLRRRAVKVLKILNKIKKKTNKHKQMMAVTKHVTRDFTISLILITIYKDATKNIKIAIFL